MACTWIAGTDWFYNTTLLKLYTVSVLPPGLCLITPLSSCAPVLLPWCIQSCLIHNPFFFLTPVFSGPPRSIWCTGLLKYSVLTLPSCYLRIQLDIQWQKASCYAAVWVCMRAEKAQKPSFIWLILFLTQSSMSALRSSIGLVEPAQV